MADFLNELASYLEDQGVGTYDADAGRNIFTGEHPADPDNCVSLIGLPSGSLGQSRDIPELQFPRFQAIVRNASYDTGSTKLQAVRTALHGKLEDDLGLTSWRVLRLHADQEGGPIGDDGQGRFEFSINFSAEVHAK